MKKYNELSDNAKEELKLVIREINDEKNVSLIFDSISNILDTFENENSVNIMKKLATVKPIYSIQTIFDLLRELSDNAYDVQGDFIELKKYVGFEIDWFKIVNFIF